MALADVLQLSLDFLASPSGELVPGSAVVKDAAEAMILMVYRQLPKAEAEAQYLAAVARLGSLKPPS